MDNAFCWHVACRPFVFFAPPGKLSPTISLDSVDRVNAFTLCSFTISIYWFFSFFILVVVYYRTFPCPKNSGQGRIREEGEQKRADLFPINIRPEGYGHTHESALSSSFFSLSRLLLSRSWARLLFADFSFLFSFDFSLSPFLFLFYFRQQPDRFDQITWPSLLNRVVVVVVVVVVVAETGNLWAVLILKLSSSFRIDLEGGIRSVQKNVFFAPAGWRGGGTMKNKLMALWMTLTGASLSLSLSLSFLFSFLRRECWPAKTLLVANQSAGHARKNQIAAEQQLCVCARGPGAV